MIKVSVIAPVYNEQLYLSQMLESLVQQDHRDWEILLVDDGSTDDTARIIEEWSARDPRIKTVSLGEKLGKVAAFNRAFEAATGDLICHVGGDDTLPRNSLSERVRALNGAPELSVALGKLQVVDAENQPVGSPIPRGANGSQSSPGATYSRKLADLIFPVPTVLPSEDIWLGNAAVACSKKVIHMRSAVINYRIHPNNSNPRHKPFKAMSRAMSERLEAYHLLLNSSLPIGVESRRKFQMFATAEQLRYEGATLRIVSLRGLPLVDRVAIASMSNPVLWTVRQHLGVLATGWRGK